MKVCGVALVMALLLGCGVPEPEMAFYSPASLEVDAEVLRALKSVSMLRVDGVGRPDFYTTKRTDQMVQYPCGSCHQKALPEPERDRISQRWSHLNIQFVHGQSMGMDCRTCHDYAQMQSLRLQDGSETDFDHSYLLCQQCHFQQARDWAGGAHGKRLAGWRGMRVIKVCTDCHNPHDPAFGQRVPMRGPTIPRSGSGTH